MPDTLPGVLASSDRKILDFERGWWLYPLPKDATILDLLGIEPSAYYGRLRELIDLPEARAYDPLTVGRLRKLLANAG